jgi:hypothetical protein
MTTIAHTIACLAIKRMYANEQKRIKGKEMSLQDEINIQEEEVNTHTEWLRELKEMQAKLLAKEVEKPKSKRILVKCVDCCFLTSCGRVFDHEDSSGLVENDNAFINEESAELQALRNTLVHKMRVAALECPVDWSGGKDKYYPTWIIKGHYGVGTLYNIRASQLPHFANRLKLEAFMNSLSTDEQKLLICGVE